MGLSIGALVLPNDVRARRLSLSQPGIPDPRGETEPGENRESRLGSLSRLVRHPNPCLLLSTFLVCSHVLTLASGECLLICQGTGPRPDWQQPCALAWKHPLWHGMVF